MQVKLKKADQITAIVLLLFSAYIIEESLKMDMFVEFAPGYGFFPFWLGVLMAILSGMLLVDAWRRPETNELAPFPTKQAFIKVAIILASLGVYAFLMEPLGYTLDTLLLVCILLGAVEREKWHWTLVVAVASTAALYVVFQKLLGVSLPKGPWGF